MNKETFLSYSDILGVGEFAIFCGAGISWNSGLPLANELERSILERLPIDMKDMHEIMNSNLPFEAFMESLSENNTDISKILDMFKDGEPNTNHILIASLAKKGYLILFSILGTPYLIPLSFFLVRASGDTIKYDKEKGKRGQIYLLTVKSGMSKMSYATNSKNCYS